MKSKNVFRCFLFSLSVLVASSTICAQTAPAACPTAQLKMPNGIVAIEQETTLVLQIIGDFNGTIEWKTSSGKIVKGQGEQIITFVAGEEDESKNITVKVKLGGLPPNCPAEVTDVFSVETMLPEGQPGASFGKIGKSKTRIVSFLGALDNLSLLLTNNPNAEGLISIQFDSRTTRNQKLKHLDRIVRHLNFRRLDLTRVTFVLVNDGEYELTELWQAMPGARWPKHLRAGQQIKAEDYQKSRSSLFKINK